MRRLPTVTQRAFERIAWAALGVLTLIVFTGAAVRLTGSGLGCPDWPSCNGASLAPEMQIHGLIEFGNRLLTGVVAFPCLLAFAASFRRRPYRRDLMLIAGLLPLGVLAQAILGGMTVWYDLAPSWVMGHHMLSMLLIVAAVALVWRARHEPGSRPRATDRQATWAPRALVPFGFIVIFAGTVATAAGPHAGGEGTGDEVVRLDWYGADTLEWAIKGHARLAAALGFATLAVWFLLRRRGTDAGALRPLTAACLLLAAQGVVGTAQYLLELPAEIVWVHVVLASLTWISLLWAAAAAGRLAPRAPDPGPREPEAPAEARELVGAP